MGVFLLELKRGDRVAAEKVNLASYVQFVWLWHVIGTVDHFWITSYKISDFHLQQVFREWGNYMQGPQSSAVRDVIQVAK